jgi:O-antigen ligase
MDRRQFHFRASLAILAGVFFFVFFSIRITNIFIIAYVFNWLLGNSREGWRWQKKGDWLLLLVISPWMLELVSVLYSTDMKDGLHEVEKRLALIALPVVTFHSVAGVVKDRARVFSLGIICTFLVSLYCLVVASYNFLYRSVNTFYWFDFTQPIICDPGYISLVINVLCIFIMREFVSSWNLPSPTRRFLFLGLIAYFGVIIFLLASKLHGLIFIAIVVIGLVDVYRRHVVSWKGSVIIIAMLVVIGFSLARSEVLTRYAHIDTYEIPAFDSPDEAFNELTLRLAILDCSVTIIKDNLFFGTGVGDVMPDLIALYRKLDFKFGFNNAYDPHNQYVRVCLATGVVGLALFLANLIATFVSALRSADWLVVSFMIVMAIAFLFESVLDRHTGIVIYAFFHSVLIFGRKDSAEMVNSR